MKKILWKLKSVPIAQVVPNERNPRIFRDEEMAKLEKSIDRFGLAEPLIANADGKLIGGHARLEVLTKRGEKTVDVYYPDRQLTDKQADELMLRLNRNIAGEFDMEKVYQMFPAEELMDFGFQDYELDLGQNVDAEQFGFRRPDFDEPGVPKEGGPNAFYFYVEYYGDAEGYQAIKERLGAAMLTEHEINPITFKEIILDGRQL